MVYLNQITTFLNKALRVQDYPSDSSQNGLQVSPNNTKKPIEKIAVAVDANLKTFEMAKDYDLLIIHHGLLWKKNPNITDILRNRLKFLFDNDIALYACHLPLDANETYGNNSEIVRLLDAHIKYAWDVGFVAEFSEPIQVDKVKALLDNKLNTNSQIFKHKETCKRFAVISGGGSWDIEKIEDPLIDLFITGDIVHPNNIVAKEKGISVIAPGHYATETLGVKAIGKKLKELYPEIIVDFIDNPNSL